MNTIPGFTLVVFPFLYQENHKLSDSILNYHNDISVIGLLLYLLSSMYVMFYQCFAPNSTVGNCRQQMSATTNKSADQIVSISIGSVNLILLDQLIPTF